MSFSRTGVELEKAPIACAMSGLVAIDAYNRLSNMDW